MKEPAVQRLGFFQQLHLFVKIFIINIGCSRSGVQNKKSIGHVVWVRCKHPINVVLGFSTKYISLPA